MCFRCPTSVTVAPTVVIHFAASSARAPGTSPKSARKIRGTGTQGGSARARLKPAAAKRALVQDWLEFPPTPARMERLPLCDPARRPRESNKVIVASPALEIEEHILCQHVVTLTPEDCSHSTSRAAVGRVIFEQLSTPSHQMRVTVHQPEAFLVVGEYSQHIP
ncbi:Auxin-induced protein 5NG4 [Hordeum vulgare]|nr:Auxin-induced protein 5NG4 [Hordeum vulgare]